MPHPGKSSVAGEKNPRHGGGRGKDEDDGEPSHNLWVGNLSNETTDPDLMDLFAKYGVLDSVTTYSSRNFAFVYFKRLEDARAAKEDLQGTVVLGSKIKIEFARPARPGKHLWVGGISSSVTKEEVEDEFLKFGKIEEFKFLRDRNTALIDYYKSEDAAAALKSMSGKRLGGEQIRVDFLRSQPPKRPFQTSGGRRGDGQPSKILWVGYPPTVQMDEQMLHNSMILFGEIERIKSFPSRHYSFVEFRSVDEARRAKEGLQGRLFNDPRIQIMFSCSELAPAPDKDSPSLLPKGHRPEVFYNEPSFGLVPVDFFGHNRPLALSNFPGVLVPKGMLGPNMLMRSFGPQGGYDPLISGPEMLNDLGGRRLSPSAAGILPSPVLGMRPPNRTGDGSDMNSFQRESKRSRIDGPSSVDDVSFPARKFDIQGTTGESYGYASGQGQSRQSPVGARGPSGGPPSNLPDSDHCWRGVIAKGGTPVCHARCIPIGKGIDSPIPEVVNCSARTGLDMLTKHYADASGFDIVYFLPDSEEDFASYTEFLRYLGAKNRAGVAKFDDGTTLFLVPPSDFLTKVLNVPGPERLYGVVLKLPQQIPSSAPPPQQSQQSIPSSQYVGREHLLSQTDNRLLPTKDNQAFLTDYNRLVHEDTMPNPPKHHLQHTAESPAMHSATQDYGSNPASQPQAGVSLTPELIATLASLLPTNIQSSVSTGAQPSMGSSAQRPSSYSASMTPDNALSGHGWRQDQVNHSNSSHYSREEQTPHQSQQFGHQSNTQAPYVSQYPSYANVSNGPESSSQGSHGGSQIHDPAMNIPQQGGRMAGNYPIPSQGGQSGVPQQVNQQYQYDGSHSSQRSYGTGSATDVTGLLPSAAFHQQHYNPVTSSAQVQQIQSALLSNGQGSADGETEKNQRYQSTLQFAANLLLQIQQQQQQQQGNGQPAHGPGNPQ